MRVLSRDWPAGRVNEHPFSWLATRPGELFPLEHAKALASAFPSDGFRRLDRSGRSTGKQYRNESRPVRWPDDANALPPIWADLVWDLFADQYRDHVAELLGQAPARGLEVRMVSHGPGDWLGPHTDRPDKAFSHVIYFNEGWKEEWGGCLEILADKSPDSRVARVVPELGSSALLRRAPNSWHQVTPTATTAPLKRRSLVVHGLIA